MKTTIELGEYELQNYINYKKHTEQKELNIIQTVIVCIVIGFSFGVFFGWAMWS